MSRNLPPRKQKGSEKRLLSLTYSQISAWVNLPARTVQQYASAGQFRRDDLESVLRWVNARRAKLGWAPIGQGEPSPELPEPAAVPVMLPPESREKAQIAPLAGGYNPLTGSY
jgi:hypothetical protein